MKAEPSDQICPTCGRLLATSQLAQLNVTLQLLIDGKFSGPKRDMIDGVVKEIGRVSQHISKCEGIVHFPENTTGNPA